MANAELFDIENKKDDQRKSEMLLTPSARLLLCLDLMDLYFSLRQPDRDELPEDDEIKWIELPLKKNG
jgi:hypothetical protein